MSDLSNEFKAWRQRMGITQARAAELLDVSPRTYQGWEAGRTERLHPRMVELALWALEKTSKKVC